MVAPAVITPKPAQYDRKVLSGPALRTFFRMAEKWGLTNEEQMTLLGSMRDRLFLNGSANVMACYLGIPWSAFPYFRYL